MNATSSVNGKPSLANATAQDASATVGDPRRAARIGLMALGLGFGGFLLWAALAPLDEGVPTQGQVAIDTKRKAVQHLSGGIVDEVLVHEGQLVKQGDVLLRLDPAVSKANFEQVRQRYLGLRAIEGRLLAEQTAAGKIAFHPDLLREQNNPEIKRHMTTQEQLLNSRRAALKADLASLQENVRGQQALIESLQAILPNRREQLKLLSEELKHTKSLAKDGYVPRNRQLELERLVGDANNAISNVLAEVTRAQSTIADLRQRAIARQQEYRKEVDTLMADVQREVESERLRYEAAQADFSRMDIKAPASGQVVGLTAQTVGGVISPGQKIMDIVPEKANLLLEANIQPHLIDKVAQGMEADVRFNTFANSPQLVVQGRVVSISNDLLSAPDNPQLAYYLARIEVTAEGRKQLGSRQLQPGMPVEVVIKTGERSMLTYLLHPLTKRLAASMTEE